MNKRIIAVYGNGNFGKALTCSALPLTELDGQTSLYAFSCHDRSDVIQAAEQIENDLKEEGSELILLCDRLSSEAMQGLWPYLEKNNLLSRTLIIEGANVPSLVAALSFREAVDTLDELSLTILSEGKAGMKSVLPE